METINDVLFGVVSFGLSRYLDHRSPNGNVFTVNCNFMLKSNINLPRTCKITNLSNQSLLVALPEGLRITGVAMINLRQQPGLQVRFFATYFNSCTVNNNFQGGSWNVNFSDGLRNYPKWWKERNQDHGGGTNLAYFFYLFIITKPVLIP